MRELVDGHGERWLVEERPEERHESHSAAEFAAEPSLVFKRPGRRRRYANYRAKFGVALDQLDDVALTEAFEEAGDAWSEFLYCTNCRRAFRSVGALTRVDADGRADACPFADCEGGAMYLLEWAELRWLYPELPEVPESGATYRPAAGPRSVRRRPGQSADLASDERANLRSDRTDGSSSVPWRPRRHD